MLGRCSPLSIPARVVRASPATALQSKMWAAVTCSCKAWGSFVVLHQSFDLSMPPSWCCRGFPRKSLLLPLQSMAAQSGNGCPPICFIVLWHAIQIPSDISLVNPEFLFLGLQKLLKTLDLRQAIRTHQCENNVCGSAPSGDFFFVHQVNDELPCQSELSLPGR